LQSSEPSEFLTLTPEGKANQEKIETFSPKKKERENNIPVCLFIPKSRLLLFAAAVCCHIIVAYTLFTWILSYY